SDGASLIVSRTTGNGDFSIEIGVVAAGSFTAPSRSAVIITLPSATPNNGDIWKVTLTGDGSLALGATYPVAPSDTAMSAVAIGLANGLNALTNVTAVA